MSSPVIDSDYASLTEALQGTAAPEELRDTLALFDVPYLSFDGLLHQGQLVMHKELAAEVKELFAELIALQFPIQKVVPIVAYDWDDEASMADNNASAFNYRLILGTDRLSNHSFGRALDINPLQNPYFARDGKVHPVQARYEPLAPGTLTHGSAPVEAFKKRGWTWGGDWKVPIDYQHFEKTSG